MHTQPILTPAAAKVTIYLFETDKGYGHFIQVESSQAHPAVILRLAVLALLDRLLKQIW